MATTVHITKEMVEATFNELDCRIMTRQDDGHNWTDTELKKKEIEEMIRNATEGIIITFISISDNWPDVAGWIDQGVNTLLQLYGLQEED